MNRSHLGRARGAGAAMPGPSLALAFALAIAPTIVHAAAAALDRIPLPPGATSTVVSTDLVQNGLRTSIATLEPAGSIDDTLAFYRDAWGEELDGHPGFVEDDAGTWKIVSRLEGDENLVVQLREGPDGIEGLLSALVVEPAERPAGDVPMPAGAQRLSTTSSRDVGSSATTTVVSAPARPGELSGFYRDELGREGWSLVSDREFEGAHIVLMNRPDRRLELVVVDSEGGGSVAILNEVFER